MRLLCWTCLKGNHGIQSTSGTCWLWGAIFNPRASQGTPTFVCFVLFFNTRLFSFLSSFSLWAFIHSLSDSFQFQRVGAMSTLQVVNSSRRGIFTMSGAEVLHLLGRGHSSYLVLVATVGLLFWVPEACNRRKDSSWQATTSGHSSGC